MTNSIIHITQLQFGYRVGEFRLAVESLCVAAQERVALIGPSGCGKTTLLLTAGGIMRPTKGEVLID